MQKDTRQQNTSIDLGEHWRIGVDTGGTFTDLVVHDAHGRLHVVKVPSTPDDPSRGVMNVLQVMAGLSARTLNELLSGCRLLVHGTTVATNIMLEGKGAQVGMITTEGFRDTLEIRRGARDNMWDHRTPFAPVLVPRRSRLGVSGRLDRDGAEVAPVDPVQVAACAEQFAAQGVESVAVCLLNSFLNPDHEEQIRTALNESRPDLWVSLSTDVAPIMGEYERGSTTVVNACLTPRVIPYLRALNEQLQECGLKHPMLVVQSNAGAISVTQLHQRAVALLLSGPAAAVGALDLVARQTGSKNLISMEIGGTSCDVVMMNEGEIGSSDEMSIAGYHIATPTIDVHTVGAGGGTIAGVDNGGMLTVGPQGAGANPGPACYGLGGTHPTVTDALLVMGRLHPGSYASGEVKLDRSLAETAISTYIAQPLGINVDEAAIGIVRLMEQNLLHAVERISIERGHDPSRCTLVAAGGAGPMHGTSVARKLGCKSVYIPRQAGAFCALGMLNTDVRYDVMRVLIDDLDTVSEARINDVYAELEHNAGQTLQDEGFSGEAARLERAIDLHYAGQQWSIKVPAEVFDRQQIRQAFEHIHQRMFGHIQPGGVLEIASLCVTGVGLISRLQPAVDTRLATEPEPVMVRDVYSENAGKMLPTPVYAGEQLAPAISLKGPVLIEESTSTIFVDQTDRVEVDPSGNYLIHIG